MEKWQLERTSTLVNQSIIWDRFFFNHFFQAPFLKFKIRNREHPKRKKTGNKKKKAQQRGPLARVVSWLVPAVNVLPVTAEMFGNPRRKVFLYD
jgi:hypothetical protein